MKETIKTKMKILIAMLFPLIGISQNNLSSMLSDHFAMGVGYSDHIVNRASIEASVYHKNFFAGIGIAKDIETEGRKEYETSLQLSQIVYSDSGINFNVSSINTATNDFYHTYNSIGLSYLFNDVKDYKCYMTKKHSRFSNIFSPSVELGYMYHTKMEMEINQENSRWLIQSGFDVIVSNIIGSVRYSNGSIKVKAMILL